MKTNKQLRFLLCAIFFSLCISGCEKKTMIEDTAIKVNSEGAIQLEVQESEENEENSWRASERKICVIFGYEYNSEEFVSAAMAAFGSRYGFAEDGGLILPFVYPDDFTHGGRARVSLLKDMVSDYALDGMIILGAPEATNKALAAIEDDFGGSKPYPVVAFFPQDDMLGIESTCDLVFEKGSEISKEEMLEILFAAIEYLPACEGNLALRSEAEHAMQMLEGKKSVKLYVDSETGLTPENHFILE